MVTRGRTRAGRRGGFSLIEATIAMTISTVLVLAVGSVFLAQSDFYANLNGRAEIQEYGRTVVQRVQAAAGSMVSGGLLLADSLEFAIRRPQTLAIVCAMQGSNAHSLLSSGVETVDDAVADGMGKLDPSTGTWTFSSGSTGSVTGPTGGTPAGRCYTTGTDTVGVRDDFMRLNGLSGWFGGVTPSVGEIYMFYEDVHFEITTSTLNSQVWGLFEGYYGETLGEFVTGLDSLSYFEYRVSGNWTTSVSSGSLANVDAIRVHAAMRAPTSGSSEDATFSMVVDVPFREDP